MSLLADDILAAAGTPLDRMVHGAFSGLGRAIRTAQRIALTAEARQFSRIICRRPSQASLVAEAMYPHSQIARWIEWRSERRGPVIGAEDATRGMKASEDRVGVLASPVGGGATFLTMAWNFLDKRLPPGICVTGIVRDSHPDITFRPRVDELWRIMGYPGGAPDRFRAPSAAASVKSHLLRLNASAKAADIEATLEEERRTAVMPEPFMLRYLASLPAAQGLQAMGAAWDDLQGDVGLAYHAAALFHTGALQASSADLGGINKARRKSRKPELLQHEVWDVDQKLGKALRTAGHTAEEVQQHLVGGHFKRRATGVFWWRPHIRGARQDTAA